MKKKLLLLVLLVSFFSVFAQKESKIDSIVKKEKKVKFVGIPVVNYNNSFGASLGFFASSFYHLSSKDTISPLSTSGLFGMYSSNDTWFLGQVNKLYLKEDRVRLKAVLGGGSVNFQTFAYFPNIIDGLPIGITEDEGVFVDYNTSVQFIFQESLFKVRQHLYLGGQFVFSNAKTTFDLPTKPQEKVTQFGFGVASELDSRDSQFMPTRGKHSKFNTLSFFEDLASTNTYTKINMIYNHYFPLQERNTILLRFYADVSVGDVPFSGQNIVGRDDLRGYSNGKYRANQVYAAQTEYRRWISKRWGYVAFGGFATAVDDLGVLSFDALLPAAGAGVRFLALPKQKISIGIDAAVGKDDWGLYFRIQEAFTR